MKRPFKLSRVRVAFQVVLHFAIVAHVVAWYVFDWRGVAALDFQDFFHSLLHEGVVTAAVVFTGTIYLASLVFGRLFCSWGCHFGATQDLAAWILRRLGWRPRLVRTRLLHLGPWLVLAVVFVAPAATTWWAEGWSFQGVVDGGLLGGAGPWDRLPGWILSVITFAVCGAAILGFLGTRGFCRFVCPYGAVFRITDRVAPYRVRRTAPCAGGCGAGTPPCTVSCPTAIDVHAETGRHGHVVSVDCVRCHLCIEACPSGALAHALPSATPPELVQKRGSDTEGKPLESKPPHTFGLGEEILIAAVAVATYAAVDLVYGGHFLAATLGLGQGVLTAFTLRALRRRDLELAGRALRVDGRWTPWGFALAGVFLLTLPALWHAASFKAHRALGAAAIVEDSGAEELRGAIRHLETARRRFPEDPRTLRALTLAYERLDDPRALDSARVLCRLAPEDLERLENLRRLLVRFGRTTEAAWAQRRIAELRAAAVSAESGGDR